MRSKSCILLSCLLPLILQAGSVRFRKIPVQAQLKAPESFLYDPETDSYFISNVNGTPAAMDNNGFITRLGSDLSVREPKFISGRAAGPVLNGPKGMAVYQGKLYLTDITSVRAFDIKTGKLIRALRLTPMRPKFLNDICALEGKIYVTDTGTRRILELDPGLRSCKILCELKYPPNGIVPAPDGKSLTCVTWGPGKILEITLEGKVRKIFDAEPKGLGNFDGAVYDKAGNLYVSSFTRGTIYRFTRRGGLKAVYSGLTTPADIGIDSRGRLLVPLMQANGAVVLEPLKQR